MVKEKVMLDMLDNRGVSLVRQRYYVEGDNEYPIGEQWRRAYYNNEEGIEDLKSEVEEPYLSIILQMWGVE